MICLNASVRFHGAVVHPNGGRVPVSTENLLLRECVLKNTDFVEGIVIYAGHETKALLNNGEPRYKVKKFKKKIKLIIEIIKIVNPHSRIITIFLFYKKK